MEVAFVLYEGFTALDAVGPYEVLNHLPGVKVRFVAKEAGPVRTDRGALSLVAECGLADLPHPDALLLPGGLKGTFAAMRDPVLLDWIRTAHAQSQWTLSVCTGSLILAAAGLLHGKKATTHWLTADDLARFGATYQQERMVRDGKLITAAGVSAGIDMALYLADTLTGTQAAQTVQLLLEYDPHPPFDMGSPAKASQEVLALAKKVLSTEMTAATA